MAEIKQAVEIPVSTIEFHNFNPNEMSDYKFNELVERIKKLGFRQPISVTPLGEGKYRVYAGEHRVRAAMVLGMDKIPAYIDEFDNDSEMFEMVKDNMISGKMNAKKFTRIVNELVTKYGRDTLRQMFALEQNEFDRYYQEVRNTLDPAMQAKLDGVKEEIKTIDDLAKVLNRLFTEYGDTLDLNFMVVDYGGEHHLWIRSDKELWKMCEELKDVCTTQKLDMVEVMKLLFEGKETLQSLKTKEVENG